jgi:hypothetical protein
MVVAIDLGGTKILAGAVDARTEILPAFGLSCALLFLFWHGHWNWSRRYGLEDFASMVLSFFFVFVMLCYIYPMKYVTSILVAWITDRRLEVGANISSTDELYGIFTIYSIGFVSLCIAVLLLYLRAWLGIFAPAGCHADLGCNSWPAI